MALNGADMDPGYDLAFTILKVACDANATAKRLAEIAAAEKRLAEQESKLAAAQAALAERERGLTSEHDKREGALAARFETVRSAESAMAAREERVAELEYLRPATIDRDFQGFGTMTREPPRSR